MTNVATLPIRFTVCTYNIWTWTRWPERREALREFAVQHRPDIFCVQELQSESRECLDEVLGATHDRVDGTEPGWECEGNIWWNRSLFELIGFGAENVGICEEHRRLFWVRLRVRDGSGRTLLVSTAHWTWHGHPVALESEKNVRLPQARATAAVLNRRRVEHEPQFFMGDLNDSTEPIYVLRRDGFLDCFEGLGRAPRPTIPARPTAHGADQTIDWLFARGPVRAMTAEVVDFWHGDLAPSDHKPVLATYEIAAAD